MRVKQTPSRLVISERLLLMAIFGMMFAIPGAAMLAISAVLLLADIYVGSLLVAVVGGPFFVLGVFVVIRQTVRNRWIFDKTTGEYTFVSWKYFKGPEIETVLPLSDIVDVALREHIVEEGTVRGFFVLTLILRNGAEHSMEDSSRSYAIRSRKRLAAQIRSFLGVQPTEGKIDRRSPGAVGS